jgi:hypothetical protein
MFTFDSTSRRHGMSVCHADSRVLESGTACGAFSSRAHGSDSAEYAGSTAFAGVELCQAGIAFPQPDWPVQAAGLAASKSREYGTH